MEPSRWKWSTAIVSKMLACIGGNECVLLRKVNVLFRSF